MASIREQKNSNCLIRRTEGGTSNITKITNQASDRTRKTRATEEPGAPQV